MLEYKVITVSPTMTWDQKNNALNKMAADGWVLLTVDQGTAYFYREKFEGFTDQNESGQELDANK